VETFLQKSNEIELDGYKWIGKNRTRVNNNAKRGSGGVGFLIKTELLDVLKCEILDQESEDILWIKLFNDSGCSLILCVCYLPPVDSTRYVDSDTFFSTLRDHVYTYQNDGVVYMCGDFNSRPGDKSDYIVGVDDVPERHVVDHIANSYGEQLIDFLIDCNFCMLNGRVGNNNDYTYVSVNGRSTVDYVLVPHEQLQQTTDFAVRRMSDLISAGRARVPDKLPDHSLLEWTVDLSGFGVQVTSGHGHSEGGVSTQCPSTTRFNTKNIPGDFLSSTELLQSVTDTIQHIEDQIQVNDDINSAYSEFTNWLCDTLEQSNCCNRKPALGRSRQKSLRKPYWNDELDEQWQRVNTAETIWLNCKRTGTCRQRHLKERYCFERRSFDRINRKFKRRHQRDEENKMLQLLQENSNQDMFWKAFGKLGIGSERQHRIPWEVNGENGEVITDVGMVLDKWKSDYEHLYTIDQGSDKYDDDHLEFVKTSLSQGDAVSEQAQSTDPVLNSPISVQEVEEAVVRAKLRKAVGIDDIPAEALKNPTCIKLLHTIIVYCFENGVVPEAWQTGIINPIVKPNSTVLRDPLSYRGITLISVPCKIYCDVLNRRVSAWTEANNVLVEEQNGFRKDRNCLEHMYSLYNITNNRRLKKESTYACFIDMKKAFDSVNRDCLWFKLRACGIGGKMFDAVKSLYTDVRCAVRVNGMLTSLFPVSSGVKQGCLLSPTLFGIYVNDLASAINELNCGIQIDDRNVSILLYADDIVLLASSEDKLQRMLNKVHDWCTKWRLSINQSKTKVVHFRPKDHARSTTVFRCGEDMIEFASTYKYLGLWFDEHLDFKFAVSELAKSASRALGSLCSKFIKTGGMAFHVFTQLYASLVQPILTYGCPLWGMYEHKVINTVQNRASRFFLGVPKNASNIATRGDLGWTSAVTKQRIELYRFWYKLCHLQENRLPSMIHAWSLRLNRSWDVRVKNLMKKQEIDVLLTFQGIKSCMKKVKQRLFLLDEQAWFKDMWNDTGKANGNKLRTYRLFKKDLIADPYVTQSMPRCYRRVLAKLRGGSLPLRVETGRYRPTTPLTQRVCTICKNDVEHEIHFLIDCDIYSDTKSVLMSKISSFIDFSSFSSNDKFVFIMNCSAVQRALASTLFFMMRRRQLFIDVI
jgi:hypothetical protein